VFQLHIPIDALVLVIVALASNIRDLVVVSIRDHIEEHYRRCADQKMRVVWLSLATKKGKCG
jgi:hypothetical protein